MSLDLQEIVNLLIKGDTVLWEDIASYELLTVLLGMLAVLSDTYELPIEIRMDGKGKKGFELIYILAVEISPVELKAQRKRFGYTG